MTTLPVAGRERQRAMGEVPAGSPPDVETPSEIPHSQLEKGKEWHSYLTEDLPRTVLESTDSAIRSARSLQQNSSSHLRSLQDFLPHMRSQYKTYEDAFFKRAKDELVSASEHPTFAGGIALTAALLLMRGPRRFLFRHTLGRFQSEEAQFSRAEKSLKELNISIDLVKNESRKLLERAHLAEKEMREGHSELIHAGRQIQGLAKSVYKAETQTSDLMDVLREIPGREALKLRAEVASLASFLRQQRRDMGKRIMKISDLGVPV